MTVKTAGAAAGRSGARGPGWAPARAGTAEQLSRCGPGGPGERMPGRTAPLEVACGKFDQAIADFAETYADQNERDHAALQDAVKDGNVESTTEI